MAEFNLKELNDFISQLQGNESINIEDLMSLVKNDFEEFNVETNEEYRRFIVPIDYQESVVEFLLLKHIYKYYILNLEQSKFISETLLANEEISKIIIQDTEGNVTEYLERNKKLGEDLEGLNALFRNLGNALLGKSFKLEVFRNGNTE